MRAYVFRLRALRNFLMEHGHPIIASSWQLLPPQSTARSRSWASRWAIQAHGPKSAAMDVHTTMATRHWISGRERARSFAAVRAV